MSSSLPTPNEFTRVPAALTGFRPQAALVLGSGLGGFADACRTLFEVPYADIPGLPVSKVPGHAGKFVGAELGGVPLLLAMGPPKNVSATQCSKVNPCRCTSEARASMAAKQKIRQSTALMDRIINRSQRRERRGSSGGRRLTSRRPHPY
jgi:hypothetical protein